MLDRRVVVQTIDEALPPARIQQLPPELTLRSRVGRPTRLRHHRHHLFAGYEAAEPRRYVTRGFRTQNAGQIRQPLRSRGRLVIDHVVDATLSVLDRRE